MYIYLDVTRNSINYLLCKIRYMKNILHEMYDLHYMADEVFSAGN